LFLNHGVGDQLYVVILRLRETEYCGLALGIAIKFYSVLLPCTGWCKKNGPPVLFLG